MALERTHPLTELRLCRLPAGARSSYSPPYPLILPVGVLALRGKELESRADKNICYSHRSPDNKYRRGVQTFDNAVWEREREYIVLINSYANSAHPPVKQQQSLDTGDSLLAVALSLIHI